MALLDFTLKKIEPAVKTYDWPKDDFKPDGPWEHHYILYSLESGRLGRKGVLNLKHSPTRLTVDFQRYGESNYSYFVHSDFVYKSASLCPPVNWTFETKMAKQTDAEPMEYTGQSKTCKVTAGQLHVHQSDQVKTVPMNEQYTDKWCLVNAIQRLSPEMNDIHFDLIDELDQIKSGQILKFRKTVQVESDKGTQTLHGFDHLGEGTIPFTYWCDPQGRLLFFMSGMELYILKSTNGQSIAYDDKTSLYPLNKQTDRGVWLKK